MRKRTTALLVVAGGLLGGPAAALEEDRLSYYVGTGLTYDDNLLRLPSEQQPGDVGFPGRPRHSLITNVYARGLLTLPVSRQLFVVDATVFHNRYTDYNELDFTGFNASGRWAWELGNRWRGNLSAGRTEALTSFSDLTFATTRVFVRNIQTVYTVAGDADYWIHPNWRITGGAGYVKAENSAAQIRFSDVEQYSVNAGFRYITTRENFIRVTGAYTTGDYPNRPAPTPISDTEFRQYDLGVDAYWKVEQKSELIARVAFTRRELPNLSGRDFTGPTGRINWIWQATGKTGINVGARREAGAVEDITATYIVTTGVSVAPYWSITSKIRAEAGYEWFTRDYQGDPIAAGLPQREDTFNVARAAISWFPTRNWTVGLSYTYSTRSSNIPLGDFRDNTALLSVQFGW